MRPGAGAAASPWANLRGTGCNAGPPVLTSGPTMNLPTELMPPPLLVRSAIAAVWLYEGLWCKVLGRRPSQERIVEAVPFLGPGIGPVFLKALGVVEVLLGLWVLSGWEPVWAAMVQTVLLVGMNANGLLFARKLIHDPAEMVVKNAALIVLMWVAAAQGRAAP